MECPITQNHLTSFSSQYNVWIGLRNDSWGKIKRGLGGGSFWEGDTWPKQYPESDSPAPGIINCYAFSPDVPFHFFSFFSHLFFCPPSPPLKIPRANTGLRNVNFFFLFFFCATWQRRKIGAHIEINNVPDIFYWFFFLNLTMRPSTFIIFTCCIYFFIFLSNAIARDTTGKWKFSKTKWENCCFFFFLFPFLFSWMKFVLRWRKRDAAVGDAKKWHICWWYTGACLSHAVDSLCVLLFGN